jgi:4a-hydroxytetrahydrobiopterin dehydratase
VALTRGEVSAAVGAQGWRFLLGTIRTRIPATSLAEAADVAVRAVAAAGPGADASLSAWVRHDAVLLALQSPADASVTPVEIEMAHRITAALDGRTEPGPLQLTEIAIDALDIALVRPFWKAVLAYVDDGTALVDPLGIGVAVWFQQMDAPRPQRNRIHFDVCVPHDEAPARLAAALAGGGVLLSDEWAPAFWVLADAEGNEACITTWQGRD